MESSPPPLSPNDDVLTFSRPLTMDRRLRPPHDQALKCPRCDSAHTKFCYYNNYSLSQPRYFCKTCRRYWTKGGTLRNIPVGGGCRKAKKPSSSKKKQNDNAYPVVSQNNATDLQLSFPIDFMESKPEGNFGNTHGDHNNNDDGFDFDFDFTGHDFHGDVCATFGMSILDGNVDTCQRLVLPRGDAANEQSFGYVNGLDAWPGVMNNYGPSSTSPLV